MNGTQLKNSILQWAIQGKLVPQNPKDEPAQKLLERIAASRNESFLSLPKGTSSTSLRGAKATKQSKNPPSRIYRENGVWYEQVGTAAPKDISDEIPFEIPENWAWCRLKDYLDVRDGTHDSPKYYSSGIPFVTSKNLVNGQIDFSNVKYISQEDHEAFSARSKVDDNDILFAMIGSIGNPVLVKKTCDFSIKNVALFKPYNEETDMHYMLLYFQHIQTGLKKIAAGGVQSFISLNVFRNWLFPLPPLAEQKRIVAKLEQVLPLADEYGAAQEQLDKLNRELPEALKKSILQQAIQGKLVPQNPKDEPAQKLLERIAFCRHSEQSEESSKRSKKTTKNPTSRIYCENGTWYEQIGNTDPKDISDEIPFDIPTSWVWCRVENISQSYIGLTYKPQDVASEGTVVLRSSNIKNGQVVLDDIVRVKMELSEKYYVQENDILICARNGSKKLVGKAALIPKFDEKMTFGAFMAICKTPFYAYVYYYLMSDLFYSQLWNVSGTTTINQLTQNNFNRFLVPLPPLAEQKRIVAKLEQLFKVL